ncbi:hypothetical protein HKD37_13G038251 [Glycine soja]
MQSGCFLELTSQDVMLAQNKLLAKTLESFTTTLSNLPQQLHAMHHSPSLVMHIRRCNICGGTHESGSCMVQDDVINYMGSQNHQGFHQGGPLDFYQRDNFSHDQGWRSHPGNNFNQGGSPYQPPSQEPSLQEETTRLEELLPKEECKVIFTEREEKEKKTEEDVRDEEGEKKEERERNEEKTQQWKKCSQVDVQQKIIL